MKPQLRVEENASTGYEWSIIEQVNCHVNTYNTDMPETHDSMFIVGGGHTKVFELDPIEQGEYRLAVVYHRPWEKDKPGLYSLSLEGSW